ncbi:MAG TPA: hypothetical protein DF984_01590 [Anaerolineaceae bacterium]|nr:hypothetical protein [Anaerolineaceae bacterium]
MFIYFMGKIDLVILFEEIYLARTVQGKTNIWRLSDKPIGSGDAGEVFAVTCVDHPEFTGVLKKPARIATGGTLQRQAGQIALEGLALARLDGLPDCKAHPPRLLDQAPDFTTGTANFFIVSETASGENLAEMLNQSRINHKPFPRRVIITVLDSLFDLFARSHRTGILWNDVKLDHIYWHNPTGGVSVIDWGNAIFLEEKPDKQRRTPPRWEDYRQMVDTLGLFLQQNAPELFDDLGWDEFQGQELNLTSVSVLARRIAYQQEVVALRVMEFQALIKVVLAAEPTLNGLQSIQKYQKTLEQIGAPWFSSEILSYARHLVESQLADDDRSSAVRTLTIVWDLFDESLDLSWHLFKEYSQQTTLLTDTNLLELTRFTFAERWSEVLWTLARIARNLEDVPWWNRLIPVIRQKALGVAFPAPYHIGESVLAWASAQGESSLVTKLNAILLNWRTKGEDLTVSPFDYELLDLVRGKPNLPRRIQSEVKQTFAAGNEAIRDLFQAWVNLDWEAFPKTLRRIMGWDPDRWELLHLAEIIDEFQDWMQQLYIGPQPQDSIPSFIDAMLSAIPPIERLLGSAPWYSAMLNALRSIRQGVPIRDFRPAVQAWFPWLLSVEDINATAREKSEPGAKEIDSTLKQFVQHLRSWSDVDAGLAQVRTGAPGYFTFCKRLADGFQSIVNLTTYMDRIGSECGTPIHDDLYEPCEILKRLIVWRRLIVERKFSEALECLMGAPVSNWRLLDHAGQETTFWRDDISPLLDAIREFNPPSEPFSPASAGLNSAAVAAHEMNRIWRSIYTAGLHQHLLETLQESIETSRVAFFEWRHEMETCNDQTRYLLYNSQLSLIRAISDTHLRLSQHIRQARLDLMTLDLESEVPFAVQLRNAENLLDHLNAIETLFIPEETDRHFPVWQQSFQAVHFAETQDAQKDAVLALSSEHPLYTWLVQSLLAK